MVDVIDGKKISGDILAKVKSETALLNKNHKIQPGIAVIIVGEDPASQVYVASKEKRAKECGFLSLKHSLSRDTSENDLLALIETLNQDKTIHGILVQLPLPSHMNSDHIIQTISPDKDVDGFHYINAGKLATGAIADAFVPCTPAGAMIMITSRLGQDLSGKDAVIVGRSNIVGKPIAALLLAANATVTIAHSRTRDIDDVCRSADILVAAVGQPKMIKGDWIKPGATVIDVGISRIPAPEKGEGKTRLVGDVDYEDAEKVAASITPVPGGVGPMTIAMLMANTLKAACLAHGLECPKF
ncbi:bifunctional methylenetetrahydrofolate dehydrogenase/methenyltetrahydrofolate cyclohydrolase FolD [Bartonella tamiae]|uniref:bifunctional methylenetetrahydrofolate dehydrogenase/methenyltetrahydrofolate cyclohydrolase FolD n=1 Tax=Bartonella tamiae TaxID=373638 RepID=UPI00026E7D76|nr:bifunctional methylenetetrahydrofolate dehydrogenase/methenyltetrahydrofolate cyclohydrolase FolD [Bartonella tamiae]EJF92746.1 FolD protein [Bartonella tamiae Th307]